MKYDELIKAVNSILAEYDIKLTLRQVYYRLVAKNLIPNTKTSYKGLSKQLVKARENGEVDDSRIEDRSRKVQGVGDWGYSSIEQFLKARIQEFKECPKYWTRKMWLNQPIKVTIALEKDALSRLFVDVADGFRVQVYATRGYGSYTFVKDMADDLSTEKPNVILFFGDYDPSGRDIQRDLKTRLVRYFGNDNFVVNRIALTPEQISEYKLPPMPEDAETLAKLQRDPRVKTYGMNYAVELDAIEPDELQRIIREAIESQIDSGQWAADREQIKNDRHKLAKKMENVKVEFPEEEEEP